MVINDIESLSAARTPSKLPQNAHELGELYDEEYYRKGCGPVPYARSEPQWAPFFGSLADQLIRALRPSSILDAGCALGFLVEAFWDRGVRAVGVDVSPFAIANVRRDIQPYCRLGSIADGIDGKYDLITCIEVVEHMPPEQSARAIANLTEATDTILFSSTPYDLEEATHFNVQPLIFWLEAFRKRGFSPDLGFDATFIASHAILFRRSPPLTDDVLRLYATALHQRHEIIVRDGRIAERDRRIASLEDSGRRVATLEKELAEARAELAQADHLQDELKIELERLVAQVENLAPLSGPPALAQPAGASNAALENVAGALRAHGSALKSLEYRIGALEQRTSQVAISVDSVLQSKIWKTLVKGGGVIQRLTGK